MGTRIDQLQDQDVFLDSVRQQPIGFQMQFPVPLPKPRQGMVAKARRKGFAQAACAEGGDVLYCRNGFQFVQFPDLLSPGFLLYYLIPARRNRVRNGFLLAVSYLLYLNWKPSFALVLLGVSLVTYWGGRVLEPREDMPERGHGRTKLAWLFAVMGLLPLAVFKYAGFVNDTVRAGLAAIGLEVSLPGLNWAVPVGISFFTFQTVGYMLDVHHGRIKAERSLVAYLLFASFFPSIVSGALGMSCYNAGQMGNGIILNYGRFRMIAERKNPQIVICDVHPDFDLLVRDDNHRYLGWLKSRYDRDGIAAIFDSIDKTERFKMLSRMYRYNSRIIELLADCLHPVFNARADGFKPTGGVMDRRKIQEGKDLSRPISFDPVKLDYLGKMVEACDGIRLVFVVSPIWYGMVGGRLAPVRELCKERDIPLLDFSNDPKYVRNDGYFKDGNHMNSKGADEFTRDLVAVLEPLLSD